MGEWVSERLSIRMPLVINQEETVQFRFKLMQEMLSLPTCQHITFQLHGLEWARARARARARAISCCGVMSCWMVLSSNV